MGIFEDFRRKAPIENPDKDLCPIYIRLVIITHSRGHTEPYDDDVMRNEWDTCQIHTVCRIPIGRTKTDLHDRDVYPVDDC